MAHDHHNKFSVNLYATPLASPEFIHMANVFAPATIDSSLSNQGGGATPGIKRDQGGWNTDGHANRVIGIDSSLLGTFATLYDTPGTPTIQARLPAVHSRELVSVLRKFAAVSRRLGDLSDGYSTTVCFDETYSQRDGTLSRQPGFVKSPGQFVVSGPHLFVGNPLNKTPRSICSQGSHYDVLDLEYLPDDYLPRSVFLPDCDMQVFNSRIPEVDWSGLTGKSKSRFSDFYRMVHRRQLNQTAERTFIPAIFPRGVTHIHHHRAAHHGRHPAWRSGPVRRTIQYVAPFSLADREEDYRIAWAHFASRAALPTI